MAFIRGDLSDKKSVSYKTNKRFEGFSNAIKIKEPV